MERLAVESNGSIVDEQRFPGRQGRIVFAYLAAQKGRPVPRGELAELLWGDELPATWENALRVLMTKLRALLDESGIDGSTALTSAFGCYKLTLPDGAWIDVDAAADAVERGEAAFTRGNLGEARARASAAVALARRSFLPGEDGPWVEEKRQELRELLVRALECLRDASFAANDFAEAVRHAEEVTELEPFRESSYRRLMEAHAAAGNPAEALRVYERCRRFLADELGAYPSAETEAVYREILRSSPTSAVAEADRLEVDGDGRVPPPSAARLPERHRRKPALAAAALLLAAIAVGAILMTRGDDPPPEVLPTSVVRIDPKTLKPTQVVRIGPRADLVVTAGGYVWVTHGILRYRGNYTLRDAGDRTLTRIDPATGDAVVVGGGLAPCGLAADPSGDVWVANCYPSGPGANVVRVDAKTLKFKARWRVPAGNGFYQGLAYGGGSLWVADVSGGKIESHGITELNPQTGKARSIQFDRHANALAWSEGYGDLWMDHFLGGSVSRMHARTEDVKTHELVATNPGALVVQGDAVWVGDWATPTVVRLPAIGSRGPRNIALPVAAEQAGVTSVAAGAGGVWATVPDGHAVWRIDPKTNKPTRIPLRYFPWGVAVGDDGIWVTVRAHDA
jgi:DNA-binding SARP family transcriptional activator/streptogramin lyase